MRNIKKVQLIIEQTPLDSSSEIFSRLTESLIKEKDFSLKDLYLLDDVNFQLAIDILKEWRLDRYYMGRAKVFEIDP